MDWPLCSALAINCSLLLAFLYLHYRTRATFVWYWALGWAALLVQSLLQASKMTGLLFTLPDASTMWVSASLLWVGFVLFYLGALALTSDDKQWGVWSTCALFSGVLIFGLLEALWPKYVLKFMFASASTLLFVLSQELFAAYKRFKFSSLKATFVLTAIWGMIPLTYALVYATLRMGGLAEFLRLVAWPLLTLLSAAGMASVTLEWADQRRKQEAASIKRIVDAAEFPVMFVDAEGKIQRVNEPLVTLLGMEDGSLVGRPFSEVFQGERGGRIALTFAKGEKRVWRIAKLRGTEKTVALSISPLNKDEGCIVCFRPSSGYWFTPEQIVTAAEVVREVLLRSDPASVSMTLLRWSEEHVPCLRGAFLLCSHDFHGWILKGGQVTPLNEDETRELSKTAVDLLGDEKQRACVLGRKWNSKILPVEECERVHVLPLQVETALLGFWIIVTESRISKNHPAILIASYIALFACVQVELNELRQSAEKRWRFESLFIKALGQALKHFEGHGSPEELCLIFATEFERIFRPSVVVTALSGGGKVRAIQQRGKSIFLDRSLQESIWQKIDCGFEKVNNGFLLNTDGPETIEGWAEDLRVWLHTCVGEKICSAIVISEDEAFPHVYAKDPLWQIASLFLAVTMEVAKSERALADDFLRRALNFVGEATLFLEGDGSLRLANKEGARIYTMFCSCQTSDDWSRCPIHSLLLEETDESQSTFLRTRFLECEHRRYRLSAVYLRSDVAHVMRRIMVRIDDVSKESDYVERLVQSARILSTGSLASSVAHDVNNPLSTILMTTNLMLQRPRLSARVKTDLEKIREAAYRASSTIQSMQDFLHGRPLSEPEPVDLNNIVETTVSLLEAQAALWRIRIEKQLDEDLPPVLGNVPSIQEILLALVQNAREAITRKGERGRIVVSTKSVEECAILEVEDNGVGISADNIARIFDPMFTTKPVGEGIGMGLAVVERLVGQLNGAVDVESHEGIGSVFRVRFRCAAREKRPVHTLLKDSKTNRNAKARGLCVAFIDDDKAYLDATTRVLEKAGIEVAAYDNPSRGMEALLEGTFDAIILDIRMPQPDGLEIYERLEKDRPDLAERVIFHSAALPPNDDGQRVRDSRRPFLRKPSDENTLISYVVWVSRKSEKT